MKAIARVSFQGGALIVPVQTPYERQLLFEHVEAAAKQHGGARLDSKHQHWTVSSTNGHREVCTACRQSLNSLTYRCDGQTLCACCARLTAFAR